MKVVLVNLFGGIICPSRFSPGLTPAPTFPRPLNDSGRLSTEVSGLAQHEETRQRAFALPAGNGSAGLDRGTWAIFAPSLMCSGARGIGHAVALEARGRALDDLLGDLDRAVEPHAPPGIRRPVITFSFSRAGSRPCRGWRSVRTRVVSWKEAAVMNESVDSESLGDAEEQGPGRRPVSCRPSPLPVYPAGDAMAFARGK
jgi:hypothetical protein